MALSEVSIFDNLNRLLHDFMRVSFCFLGESFKLLQVFLTEDEFFEPFGAFIQVVLKPTMVSIVLVVLVPSLNDLSSNFKPLVHG